MTMHKTKSLDRPAVIAGWMSIIGNTLLAGWKFWVASVSGSVAIAADAWHTLSDTISSVILLIGVKASSKPADQEHPYGHGRAELIVSLIIGVLLGMVAFEFLTESIHRLYDGGEAHYGTAAIIAMIATVVVKEAMAQYAFWAGRKTNISAVHADGWHHRSDAISSLIILVAIIFGKHFWWLDGALGIIVSGAIFYAAWDIMKHAIDPLLGKYPSEELLEKVKAINFECCGRDIETHHFHIHEYGHHTELTFHVRLNGDMPLREAHAYTRKIEKEIFEQLKIYTTIHVEPPLNGHHDINPGESEAK